MNACKTKCENEVAKLLRCFFGFITGTLAQGIYWLISVFELTLISRVEFSNATDRNSLYLNVFIISSDKVKLKLNLFSRSR